MTILHPWHLLVLAVAGWINRQQQDVITYVQEENRVLKSKLKGKRIRFTDDERRRLAVKGKALGRRMLKEVASIVTPDTILAWHRKLVARKWDFSGKRGPGRPRIQVDIAQLAVRMARENPTWGYTRIRDALSNLGHEVGRSTVATILKESGIEPAPERRRRTSWRSFLRAHWACIGASDFFTVEIWSRGGLIRYYVLFFIKLSSRRVHIAGVTPNPGGPWLRQVARNITDAEDGFLLDVRYLILDRDALFSRDYRDFLAREGIPVVRLPVRSPNLNAFAERFVRSVRQECLSRLVLFGEASLRRALAEFVDHYHRERNHQGLGGRLIDPGAEVGREGSVACSERLGGLLKYYWRCAA